jgi:hypothetical protein
LSRLSFARRWPIRDQLPEGAVEEAVEYRAESDEKFLRRLPRDLSGGEPVAGP